MQRLQNKKRRFLPYSWLYSVIYRRTILVPNVWVRLNCYHVCVNKEAKMPFQLGLVLKTEVSGTMMPINSEFLVYCCKSNRSYASKQCTPVVPTPHHRHIRWQDRHTATRTEALAVFILGGKGRIYDLGPNVVVGWTAVYSTKSRLDLVWEVTKGRCWKWTVLRIQQREESWWVTELGLKFGMCTEFETNSTRFVCKVNSQRLYYTNNQLTLLNVRIL